MINILSYVGMDLQSEVCLWTLLGLLRTIFDATLFKVNANLKQVWQMKMPEELTRPVQRVLRTMISGVILVQCFTVYVYLATYIVLLYPVFLEERPTLVLPWLLLAAIRKLLCELMSLALGLGTCVLLGPARTPCIKFLIVKLASITPAFYMWLLVLSYYHVLKMSAAFKTFSAVRSPSDHDYGLELAIRRRRTKSLQGEDQLRRKLIDSLYGERNHSMHIFNAISNQNVLETPNHSIEDIQAGLDILRPLSVTSNRTISDTGIYEDGLGCEIALPRDSDRILEQFSVMLLRIAAYLKKEEIDRVKMFHNNSQTLIKNPAIFKCSAIANDDTGTPPEIASSKGKGASYLTDYPQIFMKKSSDLFQPHTSDHELIQFKNTFFHKTESENNNNTKSVKSINSQHFVSYEMTRHTNVTEIELQNDKLIQPNVISESKDNISQASKKRISENNEKNGNMQCKSVNTRCQLQTQKRSLCIDKSSKFVECVGEKTNKSCKTKVLNDTKKVKINSNASKISEDSNK